METGHSLLICPSSSTNQICAHLKSGYFYLSDDVFRQTSRANIKPSSECSRSFFWPPQTRSTQCINWLPPSAPCSWDVTFRMATTCVISRIESKQIQHSCLAKTLLSSWYFRKNPRICSRCLTTNQTSQPLKFPPVSGYIMVMPSPHGASTSWIGGMYGPFFSIDLRPGLCHDMDHDNDLMRWNHMNSQVQSK